MGRDRKMEIDFLGYLNGGAPVLYDNKGENRSYGGELDFFYSINPFAIELGLSYTGARTMYDVRTPA